MPPAVVTVTSTVPAVPDGIWTTICVAVSLTIVAALPLPKSTAVAPARFEPVIVTVVPPTTGPADGEMDVTVGAAGATLYSSAVKSVNAGRVTPSSARSRTPG